MTGLTTGVRAAGTLAQRLQDVRRYVAHRRSGGTSPLEAELPWMSYAVIDLLEDRLRPDAVVYEYGSGGSTLFFARRAAKVVSVEHDERWARAVNNRLAELGLDHAHVLHVDVDVGDPDALPGSAFYRALPDEPADVVVVDSYDHESHRNRPILFERAEQLVRKGGIILVDDSWRYPQLRERNHARSHRTLRGLGPGSSGLQTTDVFFY
jgi:SAM-dependent methyltransferase